MNRLKLRRTAFW